MYKYNCILVTAFAAGYSIANISSQDWNDFSRWLWTMLLAVFAWTIWVLGRRFKEQMVYLVLVYYTITLMITPVFAEKKTLKETPLLMLSSMFNQAVFFTLFLSPSYHYPVFCYIPVFFILLVQMLERHFDDEEFTVEDRASGYVVGAIAAIFLWYVLQKRDLERFFHVFHATRNADTAVKK